MIKIIKTIQLYLAIVFSFFLIQCNNTKNEKNMLKLDVDTVSSIIIIQNNNNTNNNDNDNNYDDDENDKEEKQKNDQIIEKLIKQGNKNKNKRYPIKELIASKAAAWLIHRLQNGANIELNIDKYMHKIQEDKKWLDLKITKKLTQNELDATMCFLNKIGRAKFEKECFFLKDLNKGNYYQAALDFTHYRRKNDSHSQGLMKRGFIEMSIFLNILLKYNTEDLPSEQLNFHKKLDWKIVNENWEELKNGKNKEWIFKEINTIVKEYMKKLKMEQS